MSTSEREAQSPCPATVVELAERFARNREAYGSPGYHETQVRREFIDPFFEALGWDVDNEGGLAEAYKDVIHEDAIKIGGATKAPDYCFRIGGTRKFFVEAKKPAVALSSDPEAAYQLRRYAWTSKLPLSVLTDFEEFAVYDCRIRPAPTDKPATARVFYCTCDQYAAHWDWISGLFAKEAVLKGAFDQYAESNKRKRGTAEVDAEFLREIELWREMLAQNFALRNPDLSVRDLNFAVQRTIDRVVFLRLCEDRGIERYGQLQGLLNGDKVYERLGAIFRRADERYNSGLFYFTPEFGRGAIDELTLGLQLDDRVLKDVLRGLYYPDSPYEFSVLPPEILGHVYEQFLGKVIRLTKGHHAKVEEKPEVRKAGGVYYTPTYIVDYIVRNTVGKLLEERGSGLGTRGRGSGSGGLGDEADGRQALPRPGSVAESDGPRGAGLPCGESAAGAGALRTGQSDPTSGRLDSGERRGGAQPDAPGRLPSSPLHGAGLAGRVGDSSDVGGAARLGETGSRRADLGSLSARGKTPERAHRRPAKKPRPAPDPEPLGPISRLRILDPACGSGSFLLGAYQYLLDWHRDWYVAQMPGSGPQISPINADQQPASQVCNLRQSASSADKASRRSSLPIYQAAGGQWRLTIQEKKRILLNHIYGVDIDPQAVETTKLSLLLKVLEGETGETIDSTLRLFHERALPDLNRNIKCGNSLIGPDFYNGQQLNMFDEDERLRINVFDWKTEFPEVFRGSGPGGRGSGSGARVAGAQSPVPTPQSRAPDPDCGFDAVIGNPPYGAAISAPESLYLRSRFEGVSSGVDSYALFIEQAVRLAKSGGLIAFITPTGWYSGADFSPLRRLLACTTDPRVFVNLPYDVFRAWVDTTMFVLAKRADRLQWPRTVPCPVRLRTFPKRHRISESSEIDEDYLAADFTRWLAHNRDEYLTCADDAATSILGKIESVARPFSTFADIQRGVTPFSLTGRSRGRHARPAFTGTVRRYTYEPGPPAFIQFDDTLAEPKPERYFTGPRLLLRELISRKFRIQAVMVSQDFVTNKSMQSVLALPGAPDLRYLLGILNSRLLSWYFLHKSTIAQRDDFPKIVLKETRSLPVCPPGRAAPRPRGRYHRLVTLVQTMLDLHQALPAAKTPHKRTALERQIDATDRQIDRLVYELYGLTDDEIRVVEEATRGGG